MLTALMLTGRVGSGIAAELGSMVVTDQINALRALGTDPIRKLVGAARARRRLHGAGPDRHRRTPSACSAAGSSPSGSCGWPRASTGTSVVDGLYMEDVWMGLIKPFFLGFVIVTIGCHVGLRTTGGTQGVGRATTNAVVAASVAVLVVDFFVTQVADLGAVLMATPTMPNSRRAERRARRAGRAGHRVRARVDLAFDEKVILKDVSFTLRAGPHEDLPGRQRRRQVDHPEADPRPAQAGRRHHLGATASASIELTEDADDGGARRPRHGVPGRRAVRLADRARERRLQALRRDRHAARRGARSGSRKCSASSASASTSTRCRRSCRAASGAAWRSPARWPPSRGSCSTTSRPPASIRSPSVTIDAEIIKLRDLEDVSSILVTHQLRDAFYVADAHGRPRRTARSSSMPADAGQGRGSRVHDAARRRHRFEGDGRRAAGVDAIRTSRAFLS